MKIANSIRKKLPVLFDKLTKQKKTTPLGEEQASGFNRSGGVTPLGAVATREEELHIILDDIDMKHR